MKKKLTLFFGFSLVALFLIAQQEVRTYDGSNNNLQQPSWGATHTQLMRMAAPDYADQISAPGGINRPNPRRVSNALFSQTDRDGNPILINDRLSLSDYTWVFGQFIDHDITLSENSDEPAMIPVNFPDVHFNPGGAIPNVMIPMMRNKAMEGTGTDPSNPRQHFNEITAWVDGSAVYGSDAFRANWLRSGIDGKLKVSRGDLLPYNTLTGEFEGEVDIDAPFMADDVGFAPRLFVAGDIRANENALLTSFHNIFVREHNRLCEEYATNHPDWSDDQLYQRVRKIVGGMIQAITFDEWLPTMGVRLDPYTGYDATTDPSISNVFSAAAFRMGHTLLNGNINMVDVNGTPHPDGPLALRHAFFNPGIVAQEGIEPFLKGMGIQIQQDMDAKVVDDVRNFLFGPPGAGGLDLAAININRGRERGVPHFNAIREAFGLQPYTDISEIIADDEVSGTLDELYSSVNDIDAWAGMLAEQHMENALFGETVLTILHHQFSALRDGDRFYYENDAALTAEEKNLIKNTKFSEIIMRNTGIDLMQDNVFEATEHQAICGYYGQEAVVWGDVATANNIKISDVDVTLTTGNSTTPLVNQLIDGAFTLEGVPTCEDITINLTKDDAYQTGVTTLDMIMILRNIVQITPFTSPYQHIAADVNNSSSVTTADIVAIRRVILGIEEEFPNNTAWRFIDANYEFTAPNNPLAEDFREQATINLDGSPSEVASQDFVAIKVGDINNSAGQLSGFAQNSSPRSKNTLSLLVQDMDLVAGNTYTIPIRTTEPITLAGFQMNLGYIHSELDLLRVNSSLPESGFVNHKKGMLSALYYDQQNIQAKALNFELTVLAKQNARLSDVLNLASDSSPSEAYTAQLEVRPLAIQFTADPKLQVNQNHPNPYTGWTKIGFEVPVAGFVSFEVTDVTGKQLLSKEAHYSAGYHEIQVTREELSTSGVLYYHLKTDKTQVTKKMLLID